MTPWPKGRSPSPEHEAKRLATFLKNGKKRKKPDAEGRWRCSTCNGWFEASAFPPDKRQTNGLKSQCRRCHSTTVLASRDPAKKRVSNLRAESARRAKAPALPAATMRSLEAALGRACLKCGATERIQWDHVRPLAKGGAHEPLNLQPLCRPCNEKKQARFADYRSPAQVEAVRCIMFRGLQP